MSVEGPMTIDIRDELKQRLDAEAARRALPVADLISEVLKDYVDSLDANGAAWVRATQSQLAHVWPTADFSSWRRPNE
jgi:hypothetical protein